MDKNIMDEKWLEAVKKLYSRLSRLRLSQEDEDLIMKISNKL
jgi:hypothetical protein